MANLDRDALYRLDMAVKHIDNTLNKLNSIDAELNSNGLLAKLIEAVKMHQLYVLNFKKFLNNEIDWAPPNYTQCSFGQLYYSIDKSYVSKTYGEATTSMFERIGDIHMRFHETAEECLRAQSIYEFKILIIELASKSVLLVDTVFKFLKSLSQNNNTSSRSYL